MFFTQFFFPVPHFAFTLQRSEMRIGLGVNNCRSKSPGKKNLLVCVEIPRRMWMLSPRVCFLEKSSFTHSLMVGLPTISFSSLLTPRADSRAPGCLCWPCVHEQAAVSLGCAWFAVSVFLPWLLLNLNGNSTDNQGLNPAKCWHSSNAWLLCWSDWQCISS